jgi:hypothetical protein
MWVHVANILSALAGFVILLLLLAYSLQSLATGKDVLPPAASNKYTVAALVLVAITTLINVSSRLASGMTAAQTDKAGPGDKADPDEQARRVRHRAIKRGLVGSSPVRRRP